MEKHINKIAIEILKEEYSDYPENDWHYNREYRMLVKAQNRVKKLNIDDVSNSDNRKLTATHYPMAPKDSNVCMVCNETIAKHYC